MKKIKEYTDEDFDFTGELFEVELDEIIAGIPDFKDPYAPDELKELKEGVSKEWKEKFAEFGEKIIVDKQTNGDCFNMELHCKNGMVLLSEPMQGEPTPHNMYKAFSECLDKLDTCISFFVMHTAYLKGEGEKTKNLLQAVFNK